MNQILQLCTQLVQASNLSDPQKQAWLSQLSSVGITSESFLDLQKEIEQSNQTAQLELDQKLDGILKEIDNVATEFNQEYNAISDQVKEAKSNIAKQQEQQLLSKVRAQLGLQ